MYPLGELIEQAMQAKGLSKREVVMQVGYHDLVKGLKMLDDLMEGKALGYRHTPMRHLPEVLGIPPEDFDAALNQWYVLQRIAWEDELADRGYYNERTFRPHLWIHTSRQTPSPIFAAALLGPAAFKHVRLPKEAVGPQGEVDFDLVGQVIRDHFRKKKGTTHVFGEIVSYILKRHYGDQGLEFSPDGRLINTDPLPISHGEARLTVGNKEISQESFDKLVYAITRDLFEGIEINISFDVDKEPAD